MPKKRSNDDNDSSFTSKRAKKLDGDDQQLQFDSIEASGMEKAVQMEELNTSSIHPLYIPHIIENILSRFVGCMDGCDCPNCLPNHCLRELMNLRLVCKAWSELALKLFRSRFEGLAFGDGEVSDTKRMKNFLQDMENSEDIPYQNFRFDPSYFIHKNEELFKNYLYSCGSSIVNLKLWFDNDCTMKFPKRSLTDLRLDSLKYLFFGCVNYRGKSSTENLELTYLLEALLKASGNLKKFCFSFPPKDMKSQQVIISRFGDIISNNLSKSLKNLKLEMRMTNQQMEALANLGLQLESWHCDFRGSVLDKSALRKMFDCQMNSLQEMRLLDAETKYKFEFEFPCFKKLTVFEIQGGQIIPFSYKDTFPVLEKLILYGWRDADTLITMLNASSECKTLKSLELPYKIEDPNLVYLASKCFPNVKKLEISPISHGVKAIEKVFQHMTELKELDITFPFIIEEEWNVDSIFSGIPSSDCDRILKNNELEITNLNDVQTKSSITNLSKLEKLTIQDHSDEIRLTDLTVHFALLRLENLKTLEIGRFQISDRFFQLLKEKVKVTQSYDSDSSDSSDSDSES